MTSSWDPVVNAEELVARVELAAMRAAATMRATGTALPGADDVPLHHEVTQYLQAMTLRAIENYYACREQAPASTPDDEVQGWDSDRGLFKVTVWGTVNHHVLDLAITMRLV